MKIAILSAKTGNGHNAVMNSIYSYLQDTTNEIILFPQFYEELLPSNQAMSDFYNLLQVSSFEMCKKYTEMSTLQNMDSIFKTYQYWKEALDKFFKTNEFDCIISTTPLINPYLIQYLKDAHSSQRFYIVVTDPFDPIYPGFAVKGADFYFVANETVKNILVKNEIEESKIIISGYPLHKKFAEPTIKSQNNLFEMKELDQNKKTILINCGAQGSFHYLSIIKKIYETFSNELNIIIVCGKNRTLYNICKKKFDCLIFAYTEEMKTLLSISDICITKAGANAFYECHYMKTPVLIDGMKGLLYQEEGVEEFLNETHTGIIFYDIEKLISALTGMLKEIKDYEYNIAQLTLQNGSKIVMEYVTA